MKHRNSTKQHLSQELEYLRKRVTELEARDNSLHIVENLLKTGEAGSVSILESITELVTLYDKDMAVLWSNRAAVKSAGKLLEKMVGLRCYEIWPGLISPCPNCPVKKALDTCRPQTGEILAPNGSWWYQGLSCS